MGTRGCVGVYIEGKQWRGVYNHYDSYPEGLGKEVFEHLQTVDVKQFAKDILTFSDWREYRNGGVCEYCGKKGVGQPHSINGVIITYRVVFSPEIQANIERTGYADPDVKYHGHSTDKATIHSKNAAQEALFIEYAYIVNPEKNTLDVYCSAPAKGTHTVKYQNGNTHESPNYQYKFVVELDIAGADPNWKQISEMANEAYREESEKYEK